MSEITKDWRNDIYAVFKDLNITMVSHVPDAGHTPGVGPEHAHLKDIKRVEYVGISDDEALAAFHDCCRIEGIIPALETSHALAHAAKMAPKLQKEKIILVNLSGRGDKDMHTVSQHVRVEK